MERHGRDGQGAARLGDEAARSAARRTAAAISASVTVTMPSRWARRCANVRRPSACVRVPSAIVRATSSADQRTISPALERLLRVRGELRLDPDDPGVGHERLDGDRDAARQPAAADRDEDRGDVRQVLDDLEADRALPGDDPVVVVRRDDREPRSAAIASARSRRSSDAGPTVTISAPSAATRSRLMAGASLGHHDDGRRPEQAGRPGDALGVVARRVRDDAARALGVGERGDGDVGAADLEGADRLEALGLQEDAVLGRAERHERRAERDPAEDARRPRGRHRSPTRSAASVTGARGRRAAWQSMQWAAHGSASSRSGAIGLPQRRHVPYVPPSSRASAASTSSRCWVARSRRARSRCCSKTWLAAAACEPYVIWPGRLDRLAELGEQVRALGLQRARGWRPDRLVHRRTVRPSRCAAARSAVYSGGVPPKEAPTWPSRSIPCAGWRSTHDLAAVLRARRHDLLVLRQGLPARVQGRPRQVPRPGLHALDVSAADEPQRNAGASRYCGSAVRSGTPRRDRPRGSGAGTAGEVPRWLDCGTSVARFAWAALPILIVAIAWVSRVVAGLIRPHVAWRS